MQVRARNAEHMGEQYRGLQRGMVIARREHFARAAQGIANGTRRCHIKFIVQFGIYLFTQGRQQFGLMLVGEWVDEFVQAAL